MANNSQIFVVVLLVLFPPLVFRMDCFDFVKMVQGPAASICREIPGIMLVWDRGRKGFIKSFPLIILIRLHLKQDS